MRTRIIKRKRIVPCCHVELTCRTYLNTASRLIENYKWRNESKQLEHLLQESLQKNHMLNSSDGRPISDLVSDVMLAELSILHL